MKVLYREDTDNSAYSDDISLLQIKTNRESVIVTDNKVAVIGSSLLTGAHENGKRWYRWKTVSSMGFRHNSNGVVIPYDAHRGVHPSPWLFRSPNAPFDILENYVFDNKVGDAFKQQAIIKYNIGKLEDLYPMVKYFDTPAYRYIPANLKFAYRSNNLEEFAGKTFGKTRINSKFLSKLQNSDPYHISIAREARGLIDNEKLHHFALMAPEEDIEFSSPNLRKLFKLLPSSTIENLLSNPISVNDSRAIGAISFSFFVNSKGTEKRLLRKEITSFTDLTQW